ncbi:unnamed protein product, partial [Coregonus sp. 'balchen']
VENELVNLPIYLNNSQVSVYRSGWVLSVACVATTTPSPKIPRNEATPAWPEDLGASWRVEEIPGCVQGCKGPVPTCGCVHGDRYYNTDQVF